MPSHRKSAHAANATTNQELGSRFGVQLNLLDKGVVRFLVAFSDDRAGEAQHRPTFHNPHRWLRGRSSGEPVLGPLHLPSSLLRLELPRVCPQEAWPRAISLRFVSRGQVELAAQSHSVITAVLHKLGLGPDEARLRVRNVRELPLPAIGEPASEKVGRAIVRLALDQQPLAAGAHSCRALEDRGSFGHGWELAPDLLHRVDLGLVRLRGKRAAPHTLGGERKLAAVVARDGKLVVKWPVPHRRSACANHVELKALRIALRFVQAVLVDRDLKVPRRSICVLKRPVEQDMRAELAA
mmetsp:Transcript_8499/g.27037  ORF Transcript_8499/g.27037 Transcript_8499/m.27037 type:complete len:296 (-) Transcript_8499:1034-1921(-)